MLNLNALLLSIEFLTIFPVRAKPSSGDLSSSTIFFPVAGLFLGCIAALAGGLLLKVMPPFAAAAITILFLTLLTGGFHLDGLADTSDAFYAGKNRDDILRIMRDSRVGAMGVLAIVSALLLKITFLGLFSRGQMFKALIAMPVLSRWSMTEAIFLFRYAREEGKAKIFFDGMNWKKFSASTLISAALAIWLFGVRGLLLIFLLALATFIIGESFRRKIGGLTGDTLGAINEINEILILIFLFAGRKFFL